MNLKIPQANPFAETIELEAEITDAINRVLKSGWYILGPEVTAFEQEFATYINVQHAIGVSSGTDAIHISLRAMKIGPGDEVITVAHTAVATVAAIEQCGAKPVFADIDPISYTLDPTELESLITKHTKAIIPVHLYGHPADLAPIIDFAQRNNLFVLEDCAQAHGAVYRNRRVGGWGHMAAFSFYPTKNLSAIGDGGMITTNDSELAQRVKNLREYGWQKRYISEFPGFNSRLDEIQAAILRVKLNHLDEHNLARRKLAGLYNNSLDDYLCTPTEKENCAHVYHLYVIRCSMRDKLKNFLSERGIGTGIHYPQPVHLQPAYINRFSSKLNNTENISKDILSLPLYPQMTSEMLFEVVTAVKEFIYEFKL